MLEVSPWVAVDRPQPVGVWEIVYLLTSLRYIKRIGGVLIYTPVLKAHPTAVLDRPLNMFDWSTWYTYLTEVAQVLVRS